MAKKYDKLKYIYEEKGRDGDVLQKYSGFIDE